MARRETYTMLEGQECSLADLDDQERKLVTLLRRRATTHPDWNDFDGYWLRRVAAFYDARGLTRKQSSRTMVFRIAQDLSSRLAVASGMARMPDYRDELEELIQERFPTRRAFCKATGLSEDMVCHVLARRKHVAIDTLAEALARIGYRLRIVPLEREELRESG